MTRRVWARCAPPEAEYGPDGASSETNDLHFGIASYIRCTPVALAASGNAGEGSPQNFPFLGNLPFLTRTGIYGLGP